MKIATIESSCSQNLRKQASDASNELISIVCVLNFHECVELGRAIASYLVFRQAAKLDPANKQLYRGSERTLRGTGDLFMTINIYLYIIWNNLYYLRLLIFNNDYIFFGSAHTIL
jgi:hypothetical protein